MVPCCDVQYHTDFSSKKLHVHSNAIFYQFNCFKQGVYVEEITQEQKENKEKEKQEHMLLMNT